MHRHNRRRFGRCWPLTRMRHAVAEMRERLQRLTRDITTSSVANQKRAATRNQIEESQRSSFVTERFHVNCSDLIARPRVLVVEDDAPLAHLYCTALTMNGVAVMRAAAGLTALRVVDDYRPDAV